MLQELSKGEGTFFSEYCKFKFSLMSKLKKPNFRPLFGARRQVLTHCVRNQSSGGQRRDLGRREDLASSPSFSRPANDAYFPLFLMRSLCDAAAAVHNIFPNFENLF